MEPEYFLRLDGLRFEFYLETKHTGGIGPVKWLDDCFVVDHTKIKRKGGSRLRKDMSVVDDVDEYDGGGKMPARTTRKKPTPVTPVTFNGTRNDVDDRVEISKAAKRRKTASSCFRAFLTEMESDDDSKRSATGPEIRETNDGDGKFIGAAVTERVTCNNVSDEPVDAFMVELQDGECVGATSSPASSGKVVGGAKLNDTGNDEMDEKQQEVANIGGSATERCTNSNAVLDALAKEVAVELQDGTCGGEDQLNYTGNDEMHEKPKEKESTIGDSVTEIINGNDSSDEPVKAVMAEVRDGDCAATASPALSGETVDDYQLNATGNVDMDEKQKLKEVVTNSGDAVMESMNGNAIVDKAGKEMMVELKGDGCDGKDQLHGSDKDAREEKPKEEESAIGDTVNEISNDTAVSAGHVEVVIVEEQDGKCVGTTVSSPTPLGTIVHDDQLNATSNDVLDEKQKEIVRHHGDTMLERTSGKALLGEPMNVVMVQLSGTDIDGMKEKVKERDSAIGDSVALSDKPLESVMDELKDVADCGAATAASSGSARSLLPCEEISRSSALAPEKEYLS